MRQGRRWVEGAGLHSFSVFHVLFLWNLGLSPILHINVFTKQEPSLSLDSQSFLLGFHYVGIKSLATRLNLISSFLPLCKLQSSNHWLVFLVTSSHPEAT